MLPKRAVPCCGLILFALVATACSGLVGSGCEVAVEDEATEDQLVVRSLLGVGFGRLVVVEASVLDAAVEKGPMMPRLLVHRVDGVCVASDITIAWTYGGWHANAAESMGPSGLQLLVGKWYRLRGYEAGEFRGSPEGLWAAIGDEFGPPQTSGFGFAHVFRVIGGAPLRVDGDG